MKWALELEEFEVLYKSRTAIKGQALADFLAEFTYLEDTAEDVTPTSLTTDLKQEVLTWVLYMDRSSNKQGSGAGIILITPEGIQLEYAIKFGFPAFNNEVEYKALLVGLQLAISIGVEQIQVYSDSQLIVNQVLPGSRQRSRQ